MSSLDQKASKPVETPTPTKVLAGKVAVITGSSRGFGFEVARAMAQAGARVVISSRSIETVQSGLNTLRAEGLQAAGATCDVSNLEQVEGLAGFCLEAFGKLDIWVNNAAISAPYGPTIYVNPADFFQVVQTNIMGVYHGSIIALRHFLPNRSGKLINILGRGDRQPVTMQNAYAASKAWEVSFSQALVKETQDSGVGIFMLNPGMMDTELLQNVTVIQGFEDRLKSFGTVVRMWSQPPAISAQKAVWLASAATDGRTGLTLNELTPLKMIKGTLNEAVNRLLMRKDRLVDVKISSVPPAFPLVETDKRSKPAG